MTVVHRAARRADRALAASSSPTASRHGDRTRDHRRRDRPRRLGDRHLVPARRVRPRPAPLPRPRRHRARGARRPPAGVGRDDRAPRAPRVPRPARGAARSGVRARPPVHVAVLDARLDRPPRRHRRAAGHRSSPALVLLVAVRDPDRHHRARGGPASSARSRSRVAPHDRLARHLFVLGTTAPAGQGGARRRASASSSSHERRERVGAVVRAGRARPLAVTAVWHTLAWAVFGGGVRRRDRVRRRRARRQRPATCCSCSSRAAGSRSTSARRSASSASSAGSGSTRRAGSRGSRTTRRRTTQDADRRVPERLDDGIRLEHVSFRYPGTDRVVLDDVNLDLPAGAVVALVGENGAGKTHAREAARRHVRADERPHHRRRRRPGPACRPTSGAGAWPARSRTSSASSSSRRRPSASATTPRIDERPAVERAVGRAGAAT